MKFHESKIWLFVKFHRNFTNQIASFQKYDQWLNVNRKLKMSSSFLEISTPITSVEVHRKLILKFLTHSLENITSSCRHSGISISLGLFLFVLITFTVVVLLFVLQMSDQKLSGISYLSFRPFDVHICGGYHIEGKKAFLWHNFYWIFTCSLCLKDHLLHSIDPDSAWNANGTYPVCPETKSIQKKCPAGIQPSPNISGDKR